jgi:hypothetical protein
MLPTGPLGMWLPGIHCGVISVSGPGATGISASAWYNLRGASVRSAVIWMGRFCPIAGINAAMSRKTLLKPRMLENLRIMEEDS